MLTPLHTRRPRGRFLAWIGLLTLLLLGLLAGVRGCRREPSQADDLTDAPDPLAPVRPQPERFPRGTHRPNVRESKASDPVHLGTFSPGRDLSYFTDERVWWESDHDQNDTEDDHSMHRAMEWPLRRLIELVSARGGILEVHDAYRPKGVHASRSLHQEGRAIDVTCDEMPLEDLAKLCWAAGFDWVYYEAPRKRNGAHIHCSVGRKSD